MHAATVWQVTLATDPGFASPVINLFTTVYLTLLPSMSGLLPSTSYLVRANYIDDEGNSSGFGAATLFTTTAAGTGTGPGGVSAPDPLATEWVPCV